MMHRVLPILAVLAMSPLLRGQEVRERALASISADALLEHIRFLSDDALEGRDSGSAGERAAAAYIVEHFEAWGLLPAGEDGSWLQPFEVEGKTARNVVARLVGSDPDLREEFVVIGAHYDHVGHGWYGSNGGAGEIHNGADDNASGTAAVLEIAQAFVEADIRPQRSILFILFSGEERGLVGSQYFVDHPTVARENIVAMLNLDMVGRGTGVGNFSVMGSRTSPEFPGMVANIADELGYDISTLPFGIAPSDNTSFYRKRIPVLFLTTGTHPEYHTSDDEWPLINASNCEAVARFAFVSLHTLADAPRPDFQWAELKARSYLDGLRYLLAERRKQQERENPPAAYLGVRLEGLRLREVLPGTAAAEAGLVVGDVLLAIDGVPLADGTELRARMGRFTPGDLLVLSVRRAAEELSFEVVLGAR